MRLCLSVALPEKRAHPDLSQGPADLQSAALTTELCTQVDHHLQVSSVMRKLTRLGVLRHASGDVGVSFSGSTRLRADKKVVRWLACLDGQSGSSAAGSA